MIAWPALPVSTKLCGVAIAATQKGGRGFCVGRGSEVTFLKRMEAALAGDVLLLEQQPHLLHALGEARRGSH